ncbi:MAG: hypothetical protein KF886_14525 [Candidatus Hydrogenedentes bacterium]|nr:hypothetical protein [Candidatus Hydrogenedentota bacterium]
MTGKGEQLPDLLVVLAITVVMAAILLPAVSNYNGGAVNAESGLNSVAPIMDGHVRSAPRSASSREARDVRMTPVDADADTVVAERDLSVLEDEYTPMDMVVERDGLEKLRTTDISYVIP